MICVFDMYIYMYIYIYPFSFDTFLCLYLMSDG